MRIRSNDCGFQYAAGTNGGSRHSAEGTSMKTFGWEANLIYVGPMFPSISRLFLCWGPKSKLDGKPWTNFPLRLRHWRGFYVKAKVHIYKLFTTRRPLTPLIQIDWLTDRLTDRPTDRPTDRLTDWLTVWLTDCTTTTKCNNKHTCPIGL